MRSSERLSGQAASGSPGGGVAAGPRGGSDRTAPTNARLHFSDNPVLVGARKAQNARTDEIGSVSSGPGVRAAWAGRPGTPVKPGWLNGRSESLSLSHGLQSCTLHASAGSNNSLLDHVHKKEKHALSVGVDREMHPPQLAIL